MFFSDIQLVIKTFFVFYSENWMWKWKKKDKFKYFKKFYNNFWSPVWYKWKTELRNFWDYFRLSDFFSSPSKIILFYFLTQWRHQTFISFALSLSLSIHIYIYIYIYSLACNNNNIYLKIIKMKQTILILKMMHSHNSGSVLCVFLVKLVLAIFHFFTKL